MDLKERLRMEGRLLEMLNLTTKSPLSVEELKDILASFIGILANDVGCLKYLQEQVKLRKEAYERACEGGDS